MRWLTVCLTIPALGVAYAQILTIDNNLPKQDVYNIPDEIDKKATTIKTGKDGTATTVPGGNPRQDINTIMPFDDDDTTENETDGDTNETGNQPPEGETPGTNENTGSDTTEERDTNEEPDASVPETDGDQGTSPEDGDETNGTEEDVNVNPDPVETPDNGAVATGEIVETAHGPVQGYKLHGDSGIHSYIDIPYGAFRGPFQDPTLPDSWEQTREISEHTKRCPQMQGETYVGDLDCLTLSVFTPSDVQNASVLFHIHGGSFGFGSGDPQKYGPEYIVPKGVILVLPNYRLGPLGFLCLLNETAPGNAALKDLTLALNWTYWNIKAFGGNPNNIVVSGDGSAGALVGYLALSPQSKDFVSKAITESGTVLAHWAIDRDPVATATALAHEIRKKSEVSRTEIFHETDVPTLVRAARSFNLKPCVDKNSAFLTYTPWQMLHSEKNDIPFMLGAASQAGMHEAVAACLPHINDYYENLLPKDLHFSDETTRADIAERIKNQYFGDGIITLDQIEELSLCYTDALYFSPGIRSARLLAAAGARVYFYEFGFVGKFNWEQISLGASVHGAARGDIVGYIFSHTEEVPEEAADEKHMTDLMTDLWVSFIQTGTPSANDIEWHELKPVEEAEEEWLSIGTEVKLEKGLHLDRLRLWTEMYNAYFVEHNLASHLEPRLNTVSIVAIGLFSIRKHL